MRAAIFARVSTKDKGQTTGQQVEALQAVAERHGWEVVSVVEVQESAWSKGATVAQQALEVVRDGKADVLMVWALDRIIRAGPMAALQFVQDLENHYKGKLFSMQEPFLSTATADPATRGLLLPLIAWMGEQESARKSARLKQKADFKRSAAEKLGQRARWGRGQMATDDDRARVHSLLGQGLTQRAVAASVGLSLGAVNKIAQEAKQ